MDCYINKIVNSLYCLFTVRIYGCVDQIKSGTRIETCAAFVTKSTFYFLSLLTIYCLLTLKEPLVITAVFPFVIVAVVPEKVPAT